MAERTQFGKYSVVAKVGQGAMGDVFKGHDPILNRHVALKTIASSLESSPDARLRFHREAQSIARLNHPNIVTVYDFGEEEGEVYMAMEFLEGRDLRQLIAEKRVPGLDQKLALIEQVCARVGFAHSKGVVHRDLKPANIHVLDNGHVKVMDFGLAKIGASSGMTQTGTVLGTPHYMSPEQVKGERPTPAPTSSPSARSSTSCSPATSPSRRSRCTRSSSASSRASRSRSSAGSPRFPTWWRRWRPRPS